MDRRVVVDLDRPGASAPGRAASRASALRASTRVLPWREGDPASFSVAVVPPASGSPAGDCVFPMSHDYRIDRMVLRRMEVIADVTGHRVVGVETPGITLSGHAPGATPRSYVPGPVIRRALRGDYSGIAALQAQALEEAAGVSLAGARIVGESLGAQLGTSLAARAGSVRSLELVEPVNARPLSPSRLAGLQRSLVGIEAARKAAYVRRNEANGWGVIPPFELSSPENARIDARVKAFHRQGRYALATALGLHGGLHRALGQVDRSVAVRLWMSDAGRACRPGDAEWLAGRLIERAPPFQVRVLHASRSWPEGIGHHALTDLDLLEAFARELDAEWQKDDARAR